MRDLFRWFFLTNHWDTRTILNIPVPFVARGKANSTQSPPDFFIHLLEIDFLNVQKENKNKNQGQTTL